MCAVATLGTKFQYTIRPVWVSFSFITHVLANSTYTNTSMHPTSNMQTQMNVPLETMVAITFAPIPMEASYAVATLDTEFILTIKHVKVSTLYYAWI